MFFYKETEYQGKLKRKVDELVGSEINLKKQMKVGYIGSDLFRLTEMTIRNELINSSQLNLRCNFEKRPKGFILRLNEQQKLYSIAFDNQSISEIIITNEEHILPRFLSPMWILLKLGVPLKTAKRFKSRFEIMVEPLLLTIETVKGKLTLDSNGYNFKSSIKYFGTTELKSKLEIVDNTNLKNNL